MSTRTYHPSPNCPCAMCAAEFRAPDRDAAHGQSVVFSSGGPVKRTVLVRRLTQPPYITHDLLIDLLDMPAVDRPVLIDAICASNRRRPPRR